MDGFNWGNTRTEGIYVWKKLFQYDYPNGTQIAIMLLDYEGLLKLGNQNGDAKIFGFSTMLSSMQLYNIIRDISRDVIDNLDAFCGVSQTVSEGKFQGLTVIVRDKPDDDTKPLQFGQQGEDEKQNFINITATNRTNLTDRELQTQRINNYYDSINLFYMPSPGEAITQHKSYNGNVTLLNEKFVKYVEELAKSILDPENLVVKKINGMPVSVKNFLTYTKYYTNLLNSNTFPTLTNIWQVCTYNFFQKLLSI